MSFACAAPLAARTTCETRGRRSRPDQKAQPVLAPAAAAGGRVGGSWRQRQRRAPLTTAAAGGDEGSPGSSGEGVGGSDDLQQSFQRAAATQQALEEYRQLMAALPEWGAPSPSQSDEEEDKPAAASSSSSSSSSSSAGDSEVLLRGAVLIARHRYPLLSYTEVSEQLDDLAVQVEGRMPSSQYPLKMLQTISRHLYEDRKFRGNSEDYYDADNSCINRVLERRLGIPITLGLVYMQVAERLGLPMLGVNVPGHFFVAPADPDMEFLVDAFQGGEISFLQDAEETLSKIYRRPVKLDPAFLSRRQPLPPRMFLARMLNNLKQIYNLRKSYADAYSISCYLRATRPDDLAELRDSGVYLYHLKRLPECVETLSEFVARAPPDSENVQQVQALLRSLRRD